MSFKLGEVVQLRSGGPWMTIAAVNSFIYDVMWFAGENHLMTASFKEETLVGSAENGSKKGKA